MTTTSTFKIPGGKKRGVPLHEAEDGDIRYWFDRINQDLTNNPEKQYADRDRAWLADAKKILDERGSGNAPPRANGNGQARTQSGGGARQASTALAKAPTGDMVVGSTRDVATINKMLEEAAASAHLVSPATVCGSLPEGCEIALSYVVVNPDTSKEGPGDVANVGGDKLALSGHVLKKVAAAAGVSWDSNASGRLDDGSDPHYAHYRAVGHVRNFDGSVRTLTGEVEIDMREGSPQIQAMKDRSRTGNVDVQIRDTRLFLLRHAETKAKLRAITDLGVKRSYTKAELQKPFQVARLMWTGRTDDPELRRIFAEKQADAMIGATSTLYGGAPAQAVRQAPRQLAPMIEHAMSAPALHRPPPVGATRYDDGDYHEEVPSPPPTPRPAAGAQAPEDLDQPYDDPRGDDPERY